MNEAGNTDSVNLSDGSFSIGSNVWPGLSKLVEEIGELGQVLGKIIATSGASDHWDGSDLTQRLIEEMGDVVAAIRFVERHNLGLLQTAALEERIKKKRALFEAWQALQ